MDRAWNTAVTLDSSYLRYPNHQTVQVVPHDLHHFVKSSYELMKKYEEVYHTIHNEFGVTYGFSKIEITKIKRK